MKRLLCALVVLSWVSSVGARVRADYVYTTLDVPGATATQPVGINNAMQIVGAFSVGGVLLPSHGFLLSGGAYAQLDVPGTVSGTIASGINASAQIVGYNSGSGFLLTGGNYTPINVPSSWASPVQATMANGINDSGQIVGGYSFVGGGRPPQLVAGGFLLSGGSYTDLGTVGGSAAHAINNVGQIVFAFGVLSRGTFMTLSVPGASLTDAWGINNLGQVVGVYSNNLQGLPDHGFLYNDGTYTTFDVPGSISTEARGINDNGQIVGYYTDTAGNEHGFLATPTPEPSTLVLLGCGVLGIIACGWRKWRVFRGVSV
ncbi:MAG TPA: PEP-CTERM sorting domain-containing protein [Gemmataceae bacterium]|nr:PEP-CTERM sorting domain-containing protein [Gemmataceae bacterium]